MIGICTDSSAQLPTYLVDEFGIEVVPVTVVVDDHEYLEGVNLGIDAFYDLLRSPERPEVTTTHPSAGQFALAYEQLVARGATEILSIHADLAIANTLTSARVAAHSVGVPVRVFDASTASFGVSWCVLAAAEAIAKGGDISAAAEAIERVAPTIGNVFIVGGLDMLRASARAGTESLTDTVGMPLLSLRHGRVTVIGSVNSQEEAIDAMTRAALAIHGADTPIVAAVGVGDLAASPIGEGVRAGLLACAGVRDVISYRIGPSIGTHTGPGGAGVFVIPV